MKCDKCLNERWYLTAVDEYPSCTVISFCKKGHWQNAWRGPQDPEQEILDPWIDCVDYEKDPLKGE